MNKIGIITQRTARLYSKTFLCTTICGGFAGAVTGGSLGYKYIDGENTLDTVFSTSAGFMTGSLIGITWPVTVPLIALTTITLKGLAVL